MAPLAGYTAWWDASQITGFADGASLTSWADESGNGYAMTPNVWAAPTYYKTTSAKLVNGKPAVWFDGSTTGMALGTTGSPPYPFVNQPNTICIAAFANSHANFAFSISNY